MFNYRWFCLPTFQINRIVPSLQWQRLHSVSLCFHANSTFRTLQMVIEWWILAHTMAKRMVNTGVGFVEISLIYVTLGSFLFETILFDSVHVCWNSYFLDLKAMSIKILQQEPIPIEETHHSQWSNHWCLRTTRPQVMWFLGWWRLPGWESCDYSMSMGSCFYAMTHGN